MAGCLPGALPAIGLMAGSYILSVKRIAALLLISFVPQISLRLPERTGSL